jgi:hypothetical protein
MGKKGGEEEDGDRRKEWRTRRVGRSKTSSHTQDTLPYTHATHSSTRKTYSHRRTPHTRYTRTRTRTRDRQAHFVRVPTRGLGHLGDKANSSRTKRAEGRSERGGWVGGWVGMGVRAWGGEKEGEASGRQCGTSRAKGHPAQARRGRARASLRSRVHAGPWCAASEASYVRARVRVCVSACACLCLCVLCANACVRARVRARVRAWTHRGLEHLDEGLVGERERDAQGT